MSDAPDWDKVAEDLFKRHRGFLCKYAHCDIQGDAAKELREAYERGWADGGAEATKVLHAVAVSRDELIKRYPK